MSTSRELTTISSKVSKRGLVCSSHSIANFSAHERTPHNRKGPGRSRWCTLLLLKLCRCLCMMLQKVVLGKKSWVKLSQLSCRSLKSWESVHETNQLHTTEEAVLPQEYSRKRRGDVPASHSYSCHSCLTNPLARQHLPTLYFSHSQTQQRD